jgi:hypothetical protein
MTQLTEADYEIDMGVLMATMGIDPGTVGANSAKLQFIDGKAVLTYTSMKAVPPRVLGVAMLRSAKMAEEPPVAPPLEVVEEPRPARKRTTKKAVAKK